MEIDQFTRFVVLISNIPGKNPNKDQICEHVKFLQRLEEGGQLVLCGPFVDFDGGMFIIKARSKDEALSIASQDPFTQHELKTVEVRTLQLSCKENQHLGFAQT